MTREQLNNVFRFGLVFEDSPNTHTIGYIQEKFDYIIGVKNKDLSDKYKAKCLEMDIVQHWINYWLIEEKEIDALGWNVVYWIYNWKKILRSGNFDNFKQQFEEIICPMNELKDEKCIVHPVLDNHIHDILSGESLQRKIKLLGILE